MRIRRVTKRDGRSVPFDKVKIAAAVRRAQAAVGADDERAALDVADIVELALTRRYVGERTLVPSGGEAVPGIEEIQDLVEQALIELGHAAVAITVLDLTLQLFVSADGAVTLVIPQGSLVEGGYDLEESPDLQTWARVGPFAPGNVAAFYFDLPPVTAHERRFYRSVRVPPGGR